MMKFFAGILFLGLLNTISCKTFDKGSTVIDYLNDGYDAVYKLYRNTIIQHADVNDTKGMTANVHLRRTQKNDDSKKFVMYLTDSRITGEHWEPPSEADLAAALLPVIVVTENEDLNLDHIYAMEADTKQSLNWKYDAMCLLLYNHTDKVHAMHDIQNEMIFNSKGDNMPFGSCNTTLTVKVKDGKLTGSLLTNRGACTGDVNKDFLERLAEYEVTDIDQDSIVVFGFVYDTVTGQFIKSSMKILGTASGTVNISFQFDLEVTFDKFVEIKERFDETKITKRYNEEDIK